MAWYFAPRNAQQNEFDSAWVAPAPWENSRTDVVSLVAGGWIGDGWAEKRHSIEAGVVRRGAIVLYTDAVSHLQLVGSGLSAVR